MNSTPHFAINTNLCTELSSPWRFKEANGEVWSPASVPGCVHLDLLSNGIISDPFFRANERELQWIEKGDWEYRAEFEAPAEWLKFENLELEFAGLDTFAEVYLNGEVILRADNMFVGWRIAVGERLRFGEANDLHIIFQSPVKRAMPRYENSRFRYPAVNDQAEKQVSIYSRKAPYHYGWDWGPRLVTSGVWRPIRVHGWNQARICELQLQQQTLTADVAKLQAQITVDSDFTGPAELRLTLKDGVSSQVQNFSAKLHEGIQTVTLPVTIAHPKIWWPNGLGQQHLYLIEVELVTVKGGSSASRRIGLRALEVINEQDAIGESFYLKVNGAPVFMKGANYVPPDSFPTRVTRERYDKMFQDMRAANYNMLRVWGGGYYEDDYFYDLADEYGILIWQDFMFACSLYPADETFLKSIELEAIYNIKRLRHHPSLALWCGNNEIAVAWKEWGWQDNYGYSEDDKKELDKGYEAIFNQALPNAVRRNDAGRFYFPSSPISGWGNPAEFNCGDNHFWGVWHAGWPFEDYQTYIPRFMSEYGFQSFPDIITTSKFAEPQDFDPFSEVMLHHQRSGQGNALIKRYLEEWYHPPKNFPSFLYIGQLLQAEAIKIAIEAHRRAKPFCMGTLYWQFNDCWPGASWSGIDYFGRWKALHYTVEAAYKPIIAIPVLEGGRIGVYVVSDELSQRKVQLTLSLQKFTGETIWSGNTPLIIPANSSQLVWDEMLAAFTGYSESDTLFHVELWADAKLLFGNTLYFAKPLELELPRPNLNWMIKEELGHVAINLKTDVLAKNVHLVLTEDETAHFSRNYFDLLPGTETKLIAYTKFTAEEIAAKIQFITLVDSYLS